MLKGALANWLSHYVYLAAEQFLEPNRDALNNRQL